MKLIRPLGFVVLAVAAVAVWVALAPKVPTTVPTLPSSTSYESLISQALDDDKSNNLLTTGAPQQTVVNGWTAKDLLTIIAKENADILKAQGAVVDATGNLETTPFDERIPALILIGVLGVCWAGISEMRRDREPRPAPAAPVAPTGPTWATPGAG